MTYCYCTLGKSDRPERRGYPSKLCCFTPQICFLGYVLPFFDTDGAGENINLTICVFLYLRLDRWSALKDFVAGRTVLFPSQRTTNSEESVGSKKILKRPDVLERKVDTLADQLAQLSLLGPGQPVLGDFAHIARSQGTGLTPAMSTPTRTKSAQDVASSARRRPRAG